MAYWYQKYEPREPEPLTMWAPEGELYLISVRHPKMRELYEVERLRLGNRTYEPFSDAERWAWEVGIIAKIRDLRRIPEYVVRRLLLPPYRGICEAAGMDIAVLEKCIKKGPPKRSAVS